MLIWGGTDDQWGDTSHSTGGRYDPTTDTWTPTAGTNNAPTPRLGQTAVWTGTQMIVWGGFNANTSIVTAVTASGGRYDPLTDSWSATTINGVPQARSIHTAVWTGNRMLIWGGSPGPPSSLSSGGRYDPISDTWEPMSELGAPSARNFHRSIWTGSEMLVWGGSPDDGFTHLNSGGRYEPVADVWQPMSLVNAPSPRGSHTAVWSGNRMLIWGGSGPTGRLNTGGKYDPVLDTWQAISLSGAPGARSLHSAVWTGERMVIWGGRGTSVLATGGSYDPNLDSWMITATLGAPAARQSHSAVWTGKRMVVWGGQASVVELNSGGRYDPAGNVWESMSTVGAPKPRRNHTAVWTGSKMIVWGGDEGTGGIYSVVDSPDSDLDGSTLCDGDCDDNDPSTFPGAPQICDGANNDCDDPDWPAASGTNEMDDDDDMISECQGDCNDTNATIWGRPGEVLNLVFQSDTETISWSPPLDFGGDSVAYDTVRSSSGSDFVTLASCVESDGSDSIAIDSPIPTIGGVFFYLIRAENACPGTEGQGSVGTDSNGTARSARACP